MGSGPRYAVQAPPATPSRNGLLAALSPFIDPGPDGFRWTNSYSFSPESCIGGAVRDPCDTTTVGTLDSVNAQIDTEPFTVEVSEACTTLQAYGRDWQARIRRKLAAQKQRLVEKEFWTGALAKAAGWPNQYLASPTATIISPIGAPLTPLQALQCLEKELTVCQTGRGVLHAEPDVVTAWVLQGLLRRQGSLLLTELDTIVVAGGGYTGSGPEGEARVDGAAYVYATGLPVYREDDPVFDPEDYAEIVRRANNNLEAWARQTVSISYDGCCHLACAVNIPLCGTRFS